MLLHKQSLDGEIICQGQGIIQTWDLQSKYLSLGLIIHETWKLKILILNN